MKDTNNKIQDKVFGLAQMSIQILVVVSSISGVIINNVLLQMFDGITNVNAIAQVFAPSFGDNLMGKIALYVSAFCLSFLVGFAIITMTTQRPRYKEGRFGIHEAGMVVSFASACLSGLGFFLMAFTIEISQKMKFVDMISSPWGMAKFMVCLTIAFLIPFAQSILSSHLRNQYGGLIDQMNDKLADMAQNLTVNVFGQQVKQATQEADKRYKIKKSADSEAQEQQRKLKEMLSGLGIGTNN